MNEFDLLFENEENPVKITTVIEDRGFKFQEQHGNWQFYCDGSHSDGYDAYQLIAQGDCPSPMPAERATQLMSALIKIHLKK